MSAKDPLATLRRVIADHLADDEEFRRLLEARTSDGEIPIIPARVEDSIAEIWTQIDQNYGGAGNVVFAWEGKLGVLCLNAVPEEAACQPVGESANLGTLLAVMAQENLGSMQVQIVGSIPPGGNSQLVEGKRPRVPA